MTLRLFHQNSLLIDYFFNLTFEANTPPTFNESVTDLLFNWNFPYNLTLPIGVDAEGHTINYELTPLNASPLTIDYDFSVDTVIKFASPQWTSEVFHYNYKIYGDEDQGGYFSEANFTVTLNNIPTVTLLKFIL